MGTITRITILLLLSTKSFAACNTPEIKARLLNAFKIHGVNTDWKSVRRKKSFSRNRAVPIFINPDNRLNSSRIIIKRDSYMLGNVSVCDETNPKRKGGFLITHPEYDGTLSIFRRGTEKNNSLIRLQKVGDALRFYLRPIEVVTN